MKKKGLITFISITIIFELIQVLFLREFSNKGIILDLLIAVIIAWFIGRQYDKMKFYIERMNESQKN